MNKYKDLSAEALAALATEKRAAFDTLVKNDAPTIDQVNEAEALALELDEINAEVTSREEAAAQAAEKFAALRNKFAEADENKDPNDEEVVRGDNSKRLEEDPVEEGKKTQEEKDDVTPEGYVDTNAPTGTSPGDRSEGEKASAVGSTVVKTSSVRRVAAATQRPVPATRNDGVVTITAAADVPEFATGSKMDGIAEISKAVINRMRGFAPPQGDGQSENLQKFGVATLQVPFENEFTIDRHSDDMEVLTRAADEKRLEGGSLTAAAGGWCAPSETLYDLCAGETLEGILSVPEVNVKRGGIRYTSGPDFADFYTNANGMFKQTEAQAIAGATKPCVTVDCPAFVDVRLDAIGLCIKIPILTNSAYPELVQRYVSGFMTAYQHRVNAEVIGRMVAIAGTARVLTGIGSTVQDTLGGLTLIADQRRQQRRLSMTASYEVVVPFWVKNVLRNDLGLRTGRDSSVVSDQEINSHFTARGLNISYVYDWQDLPTVDNAGTAGVNEANTYPTTFQVLMYPAGTFVKGTTDIINLSAVYDAASLAVNTYTGLFMEEGLLIAKMCNQADLVTLPICSSGRTGAANLTCP